MRKTVLACLLALAFAAGCEQKKEDAAPAAPTTPPKPAAELPRPPVGIAPQEDDLATAEEFEEEAEKDIASSNVEAEVDKLEKEIGE